MSRIEREKKTVDMMIRMYCRKKHGSGVLCRECEELLAYACCRLEHCPFGVRKTSCQHCPVHCYGSVMRGRMCVVMRYTGPRMLFRHPWIALRHLFSR